MMLARLLFVSLCVCAAAAQQWVPGQNIRNCRNNHADRFSECLMSAMKRIQPLLRKGLPEYNFTGLEPFKLQNIEFRQSVPPVSIEAIFRNVLVYGLTAFDLKYLDIDFSTTRKQSMGLTIPSLTARGQYKIGGNIFLLPIVGAGNFVLVFDGIIAEGTGDFMHEGGKIVLRNVNIGLKIRNMKIRMENLFSGNQILSDTIHHFINTNNELVMDAIMPGVTTQLNNFIEKIFDGIYSALPPDTLTEIPRRPKA